MKKSAEKLKRVKLNSQIISGYYRIFNKKKVYRKFQYNIF